MTTGEQVDAPSEVRSRGAQLRWLTLAFVLILVADQVSKAIVVALIEPGSTGYRAEVFFHFTHQRNEGLVGGMFSSWPAVTYLAPVVATLVLVYLFRHINRDSRMQALAYGMVLGGAIGNLIDRIRFQSVTDFLQFHFYFIPFDFPWKYYPAFNIADSAICVGVFLLVVSWNVSAGTTKRVSDTS